MGPPEKNNSPLSDPLREPAASPGTGARPVSVATKLSLWNRVQHHKVVEWAIAYVGFAFAALNAAVLLKDILHWSELVPRITFYCLLLGFPIAVTLAWFHGHRAQHRITRLELEILAAVLLLSGSALWLSTRPAVPRIRVAPIVYGKTCNFASTVGPGNRQGQIFTATPSGLFSPATLYTSGGKGANSVALGDFNRDGIVDLAVANAGSDTIAVLLGRPDGTFQEPPRIYSVGSVPYAIVAGDFNNDGKLDLAVANAGKAGSPGSLSILLGNGDGTFARPHFYLKGRALNQLVVADFNSDKKPDLAIPLPDENAVLVLLGNGDGTFKTAVRYRVGVTPRSVAVGDFNGDHRLDLAVPNTGIDKNGNNTISILLGKGDGTFFPARSYIVHPAKPRSEQAWGAYSALVADFNGDKVPDIAIVNFSGDEVGVLLGNGDGSFQAMRSYRTSSTTGGRGPFDLAACDFDGDGNLDIVTANNDSTATILLGRGDGTFALPQVYRTGISSASVVVGDFNNDGAPDIALANRAGDPEEKSDSTVSVLINVTNRTHTIIVSSANPSIGAAQVNITVRVASDFRVPSGYVTLSIDGDEFGTSQLAKGEVTFNLSDLLPGKHRISAQYGGAKPWFLGSSAELMQTVRAPDL